MTRAIVIKTCGDSEIAGAIVDGMSRAVTPLNDAEYAALKAELVRLRARDDIRAYGDSVRWETVQSALAVKYATPTHGRLYDAVLGAWASLWLAIDNWYKYLSAWNREG